MIGAIDIGGTKIAVAAVDRDGRVVASETCPTEPRAGFPHALGRMIGMLRRCVERADAPLEGVGIGCTGPVDPYAGIVLDVPFLPTWEGGRIAASLEAAFGVSVVLENDADAHALGEYRWGAGRGSARFVMVTVGTGIGGGMVFDGALFRGSGGTHPEIGQHVIDGASGPGGLGPRGCWESLACGPALAERYRSLVPVGARLDAKAVCLAAENGDRAALLAVETVGKYLGIGIANLVNLFAPDRVCLGGGLMAKIDLFRKAIDDAVAANTTLMPKGIARIIGAELGEASGLAGAAAAWLGRNGERTIA